MISYSLNNTCVKQKDDLLISTFTKFLLTIKSVQISFNRFNITIISFQIFSNCCFTVSYVKVTHLSFG